MASVKTAARASIRVNMGRIEYARSPDVLETLLGSCIGVVMWARAARVGGVAHVVLADSRGKDSSPDKFADTAIPAMRKELISKGCRPTDLVAKLAGGAAMFGPRTQHDVGHNNHKAVVAMLGEFNVPIVAEHVGGGQGRIIRFSPADGIVTVRIGRDEVARL